MPLVGLYFLVSDVKAKGLKNGLLNTTANQFVGSFKLGWELHGEEWFPDLPKPEFETSTEDPEVTQVAKAFMNRTYKYRKGFNGVEMGPVPSSGGAGSWVKPPANLLIYTDNKGHWYTGMQQLVQHGVIGQGDWIWDSFTNAWRPFDRNVPREILDPFGAARADPGE